MITLTDIELIDFGRHHHIKQQITGPVVGLTGANGRGKSTILQAIQFAITGTIDHPDPLNKFIRQGSRGGVAKSATVILGFKVDGRRGKITRKITKTATSRELELEGMDDGPFSADKRVAEIMFQLLEVDKRALNSTVFIRQGAIADMFGKDVERRDFYTRLLMLGHLPKIADVIDGYRKNVASSITDLSAVLDEAETAQTEATDNFTAADAQLNKLQDCTAFLEIASRLSMLFGDQSAAEAARNASMAKLGADPTAKLEALEFRIAQATTRVGEIADARLAHARAEAAGSEALRALTGAEALASLHSEMLEAATQEAAHRLVVADGDPSDKVTQLQRQIDACEAILINEPAESSMSFDFEILKAQLDGARVALADAEDLSKEAVAAYKEKRRDLDIRLNIMAEMRKADEAHTECSAQCIVCGSTTVNADYLQRTIDEEAEVVVRLNALCALSATKLKEARDADDAAAAKFASANSALTAVRARLAAAREILGDDAISKTELTPRLEVARMAARAYAHAASEVTRLGMVRVKLLESINFRVAPTTQQIEDLKTAVRNAKAALTPWDTALDDEEKVAKVSITQNQAEHALLKNTQVELDANRQWLSRVEAELETLCAKEAPHIPDDLYIRGRVMTAALAETLVMQLQRRQAEYDHLRGMKEAARTAMLAAQRRVIETEARIENQQQRVSLIERLTALRDGFKPTGVSLDYLDYKFSQVATLAADYLAESGADFTVVASENDPLAFDFIRMEPGEEWLSQSRLSGGQKVRLAVATLRAIHALVVPNVGLLVLDEPTTHLDAEAKLAMAEMLRRIGNEGGLQILVCDHDPVLVDAFSSTIEIPD